MKLIDHLRNDSKLRFVLTFALLCAVGFGYLWVNSGGHIPVIAESGAYKVSFKTKDLKNLLDDGDVKIAGIVVGHVQSRELDDGSADVTIALDKDAAPLHQGLKVRVGVKSLIGSSYVDITDGSGAEIPNHSTLPRSNVAPAVDVDELLSTLNKPTRAHLVSAVRSLDPATKGTGHPLGDVMTGAGQIANQGNTVLSALAAQSVELQSLTVSARNLLGQLDTGQGQIATLVSDADKLTSATSARQKKLTATVRALPSLIASVRTGATSLQKLSVPLKPVAADLKTAAPYLTTALNKLPSVSKDLNGLVPSLNKTLVKAPATLRRLPGFDKTVRDVVPTAQTALGNLNPMLSYIAPYGLDLGQLFGSFGGSFDEVAEDGIMPIRLTAIAEGATSVRELPIKLPDLTTWTNPYPQPGQMGHPKAYKGTYPHINRAEK